jgi:hypothetical protein
MKRAHGSRCQWFQAIFVVQPGQDGRGDDSVAVTDVMPRWLGKLLGRHLGNPRTEAGVCATLVVVSHALPENESNAVHSGGSANPNTLDGLYRSVARRTRSLAGIHGRGIDAVAIVNEEALRLIAGNNCAELLDGPFGVGCSV